ncbi:hypothetical protein [Paenibacillus sedimenti]|uniref:Uncharacterized protein n=1 Tax=Paenibacillus sedimenti TaxID=2770274 RepID=A0A926QLQ6_9BACL|nr:hypothetical protein [Paenibacillus sedimenti]MBD0383890.1 hypothetical protein [Paenibacillus sedimenti]
MFTLTEIYNLVLAKHYEVEWDTQESLEDAYSTYLELSSSQQAQFDSLVDHALGQCKSDIINCFPENRNSSLEMVIQAQVENDIMEKLVKIFQGYIID